MNELTVDYPVQGHNRVSKTGLRHSVKSHERKEKGKLQKEIILLKAAKLKKEKERMLIQDEDEWAMVHFGRTEPYPTYKEYLKKERKRLGLDLVEILTPVVSRVDYPVQGHTRGGKPVKAHTRGETNYPGKELYITKKGTRYWEFAEGSEITGGTAKAIKVGSATWIPRSVSFIRGNHPRYQTLFVRESWYPKALENKKNSRMKSLERMIKEVKETIEEAKEELKNPDPFSSATPENINRYIKQEEISLAKLYKRKEFLIETQDFTLKPVITSVLKRIDSIPFSEFEEIKTDFENSDFVIFHGAIARDGAYDYIDENGNIITLFKDIDNLKDIYSRYNYLPMKTSEIPGAHFAEEFGYATNFSINEETNEIEADLILVNDDNFKEVLSRKNEYHVSPGYNDIIKNGNIQMLTDVDHIALALGEEIGRACTGTNSKGASCTKVFKTHDQNLTEVISN